PLAVAAQDFQEGTHYRRLAEPVPTSTAPDKVEVVELFWYGCPHCFAMEPTLNKWLENAKPPAAEFVRIPAALSRSWEVHARLYYTAEALGVLDQLHGEIFEAIHVQRLPLRSEDEAAEFFAKHGVDAAAFRKAFNSFDVDVNMRRSKELVKKYGVTGVPSIIVAGKYETNGSMAGSYETLFEIVNYLVQKESGQG
nr:thiol:disulfide interchange protein DsbA/DsbL [Pseudomonadota bacterium]